MTKGRAVGLIAAALLVATAGVAAADEAGELIQRFDRDGDGRISRSEAEAYRGESFGVIDLNGDGAISRSEMLEHVQRRIEQSLDNRFQSLDVNRNGTIDLNEYESRQDRRFNAMDLNGDGVISDEELRKRRKKK